MILDYEGARHGIPKLEASGWKCILSKALKGCYRLHGFYYVWYKNEFEFSLLVVFFHHCPICDRYHSSLPLVNLSLKSTQYKLKLR
jgi:hypothetical protein